jgi:TetR/AcrR family transcriptional repressor of mexJK operon
LCAAAALFLEKGFQGASMDAVAKRAGVSKQTVYSHFDNKETLFQTCIENKVASYGFDDASLPDDADVRAALLALTHSFIDLLFDPEVIAMHRVVMAEAITHPRIAELFFASGPVKTKAVVETFLTRQVEQGRLSIPPSRVFYAGVQLFNMALGMYQMQMLMGLRTGVPQDELDQHLDQVVEDFLRLYAAVE